MKTPHQQFSKGFTILEVVISITIILIISVIVGSGFQNYQRHQWYQVIVNDVRNELSQSRIETMGSVGDTVYGAYVGTSTIEFFSGSAPVVGSVDNTIIPFSGGVYATSSFTGGGWYITFARMTGIPTATGTIDIIDSIRGVTTTLSVSETGIIE